jgi:electron transport complex protein RnfD
MKFVTKKPPIVNSQEKSLKRLLTLHIALIIISLSAILMNGFYNVADGEVFNLDQSFAVFGMIVIGAVTAFIVELLYALSEGDTSKFTSYRGFIDPLNTGILIALLLPATTPAFVLVLSVIIGTYAGKLVFGGRGYYIFNPALVGALFANASFASQLSLGEDVNGEAIITPLQGLKEVFTSGAMQTLELQDLLIGNYAEIAVGSTSVIVLLLLFVYLWLNKVVDLRLSGSFLLTVLFMSFGIGYILWAFDNGSALNYMVVNTLTGLTLFGAVFLVSESVSTPTSRETKLIFGVTVAILMMLIRTVSDSVEGLVYAVLFGNMITPFINRTVRRSNQKTLWTTVAVLAVIVIGVTIAIGFVLQGRLIDVFQTELGMMGGLY